MSKVRGVADIAGRYVRGELTGALAGLKKKSQADAKRLVALLKKRAEKEKLELVNDYEQQLKQLAGQLSQAVAYSLSRSGVRNRLSKVT